MLVHCPKSLRVQHWQLTKDRANATKEDRALLVLERTQDSIEIIKHEEKVSLSANRLPYRLPYRLPQNLMIFLMLPTCSHSNGSITLVFPSFSPNEAAILWVIHFRRRGDWSVKPWRQGPASPMVDLLGVKIVYPHCIIWFCIVIICYYSFIKLS